MSNHTPPNDHEHDLLAFADCLADGQEPTASTNLESTVLRVQRSLRGDAADPDAMPADLKTHIWEDIMQSTGAAHAAAPANPWQDSPPPPNRRARRKAPRPTNRPMLPQRMRWSGAANIALTVLLIVAAFGAVRAFEGSLPFDFGGGNGSDDPRLAAVPGTPDESILPAVQMTPEVTPDAATNAAFACDFSRSVPIYSGVDAPPADGTVLYIAANGDFTLACPEEPDPIVLSRDVSMAFATGVPGVVNLEIGNDNDTNAVMMNVITNEWVELNPATFSSYLGDANLGGSLSISTVVDSPDAWSLINLETMQSATLSDLTGAKFPASSYIMVATSADQQGVAVAASEYRSEGSATLMQQYGAQGDIAVIGADLETVHWITVPSYFPEVTNISLSPDASKVAIISNLTSFDDPTETTAISIVDVATGEEIVRSEEFVAPIASAFLQWVEDGDAIIYTTDNSVHRLELSAGATPTELYASEGTLTLMPATTQPNLVHLKETISDTENNLVILTTDLGATVTVPGDPWFSGTMPVMQWTVRLAPIVVHSNDETNETTIVHPVTGDPIAESIDSATLATPTDDQQMLSAQVVTTSSHAPVSVVNLSNGELMSIDLGGEEPVVNTLPELPEDAPDKFRLSPDGTVLSAATATWVFAEGPRWCLDLTDPDAEWVQGPEDSVVTWLVPIDQ